MPATRLDAIVVGAGVVGLATAREIARRGRRVAVLEQFRVGHTHGSSHGNARIFRLGYPDPRFVRLARDARALWNALESEVGETLIDPVGSLDLGSIATRHAGALRACDVAFELMDGRAAELRWPLAFAPDEGVLFQIDGGVMHADRALNALQQSACEAGAELHEQTRATALRTYSGHVEVDTEKGGVSAATVIVTAGAWARALLGACDIGLDVTATCETVAYFDIPAAAELPTVIDSAIPSDPDQFDLPRAGLASYSLPARSMGLKAGLHHAGPVVDPNEGQKPSEGAVRWISRWVGERFPEANPEPTAVETCLYTNTADESFVIERHSRIVVGSACSGHGFKLAPTTGLALARLAEEAIQ
jgi:sarcosine oxidase